MHWEEAQQLWLTAVEAEGRSPYTIKAYREHLRPFTKWLEGQDTSQVEELTPFHLRRFLTEYAPGHSPHTVRSIYNTLRIWLRFLVADGPLTASPLEKVKPPAAPQSSKQVYSVGELTAIRKYLEKARTPLALRDYALVSLLMDSGARASEALAVTLDDFQDGALLLRQTKGKRPRMAPLGSRAEKALWTYLQRGRGRLRPKGKELFVTDEGLPMSRNALRCVLVRLGQALGFPISAHRFRHTWATMMLRKGVDIESLRLLGGWTDYQMLKTYSHLNVADLKATVARASILDNLR